MTQVTRYTGLAVALSLIFATAAVAVGDDRNGAASNVRLAIVGQALIEHDGRKYLENPMSSVKQIFDDADIVFTNLEVAICDPQHDCSPTRHDKYFHGTGAEVLDLLKAVGVTLLALSNNHSWDYGAEGILSTIAETEARGLVHAGTGRNVSEASAPVYLDAGGLRVALVAMATVNHQEEARATSSRPGINVLDPDDSNAWDRNIAAIQTANSNADIVLVYQHFQTDAPAGWQQRWARAVIDAGAHIYISHGEPVLKGAEVYRRGLILYDLGNFIFHSKTRIGHYPQDVWQSVIGEVSLSREGVEKVTVTPIVLDEGTEGEHFLLTRGYPEVATGDLARQILERFKRLSAVYGTEVAIQGERATIEMESTGVGSKPAAGTVFRDCGKLTQDAPS